MKYQINGIELHLRDQGHGEPRIPGAQMKVIPRTGHLSPLEAPQEIAEGNGTFL
jgi:pimeloyl-ACP methyl ester carboxylesterase